MTSVEATTVTGGNVVVDDDSVCRFKQTLRGEILLDGDEAYDEARVVWNGMIDNRPAFLVRCAGVADVRRSVDFARSHDLLVAVRGGGHNIAGKSMCDGGLVIDLSPMKGMWVDPDGQTVRAQAGLRLGEFDCETQAFGLATTMGIASDTGIAGITLGGGYGWLEGKYGLACDNLLAADVVTADGHFVTASAEQNAELFWGLRGGGGNFGVVTSFQFRLYPLGQVLGGMVIHPMARAAEVLRFYGDFAASAPDELTTAFAFLSDPEGKPVVAIAVCYCGALEEGEKVLNPLKAFGPPAADLVAPMDYLALQSMLDGAFTPGRRYYWKTSLLRKVSEEVAETMILHAAEKPSPMSMLVLQQLHGAAGRVGRGETAFAHRYDHFNCIPLAAWEAPEASEENIRWARDYWSALQPHVETDCYSNDLGEIELEPADDGASGASVDRVKAAYGEAAYGRLVALKNKYDPSNFFRLNSNIEPTAGA